MSGHTPGPWSTYGYGPSLRVCVQRQESDGLCEDVCIAEFPIWREEHARERDANARLIAAAYDMLEALKKALNGLDHGLFVAINEAALEAEKAIISSQDSVKKAIAKAEGGSDEGR